MWCPLCGVEYREGFTVCSDCQVGLVPAPPRAASADAPDADDSGNASFTLLWSGSDARVHAEICEALQSRGIPVRSLDSDDYLFNLAMRPAHQVYVPAGLVGASREAVRQINAVEESLDASESDLLELPAEEGPGEEDQAEDEERGYSHDFDPQDASVQVWSGQNVGLAAMIASSLRENQIPCRRDPDPDTSDEDSQTVPGQTPATTILVFPEDEPRAKEIIREILDATPPE